MHADQLLECLLRYLEDLNTNAVNYHVRLFDHENDSDRMTNVIDKNISEIYVARPNFRMFG